MNTVTPARPTSSLRRRMLLRIALVLVILVGAAGFDQISAAASATASVQMKASVGSLIITDVQSNPTDCVLIPAGWFGAWCVLKTPVTVRVRSNDRWTGYLSGRTQVGNQWTNPELHCGGFFLHSWLDVALAFPIGRPSDIFIRNGPVGTSTYSWYLAVYVANPFRIGDVRTTLTFTTTQRTSGLSYVLSIPVTYHPTGWFR